MQKYKIYHLCSYVIPFSKNLISKKKKIIGKINWKKKKSIFDSKKKTISEEFKIKVINKNKIMCVVSCMYSKNSVLSLQLIQHYED